MPLAGFLWRRDASAEVALGTPRGGLTYAGLLAAIEPQDAARLGAAVDALRSAGTAFGATVSTPNGTAWEIEGRRTASGDSVMWLADTSAVRQAGVARSTATAAAAAMRET